MIAIRFIVFVVLVIRLAWDFLKCAPAIWKFRHEARRRIAKQEERVDRLRHPEKYRLA